MSESSTLGPDGTLKNAEDIVWYHSKTDETPLGTNLSAAAGINVDSESESSDSDANAAIDNEESLPSKTIPLTTSKKCKRRSTRRKTTRSSVVDALPAQTPGSQDPDFPNATQADAAKSKQPVACKRNPIYLFYEQLSEAPDNRPMGKDNYYCCFHGNKKVLKVTEKMCYSTNGLVSHLKANIPLMYRFYENLHNHVALPSPEEIEIATGRKSLSLTQVTSYMADLKKKTENIIDALQKQASLANYVHRPSGKNLKIPHRTTIRRHMGEIAISDMKEMFMVSTKVSLALLTHLSAEESLIDFCKLLEEHSGENIADAVWTTLTNYGIEGKLLEGIGTISKEESKKASGCGGNYQDNVILSMLRNHDEDAAKNEGYDGNSSTITDIDASLRAVKKVITIHIAWQEYLQSLTLSLEEWKAIELVTTWLTAFHSATTQMSTTKHPMLFMTYTIFRGLQDQIKMALAALPADAPSNFIQGLTDAHRKLSDYYYKFDESPLYTWAILLGPHISYSGMKLDYDNEPDLLAYTLRMPKRSSSHHTSPTGASSVIASNILMNFMARYHQQFKAPIDELEEYFKLPREDIYSCDPVKWWHGRCSQFPNLFHLARDLLSILGSAVAVEQIFSA
ncbi:hypothetical protein H0H92_001129 [Tricholoma furcatifolium]|nr:hypothetical protein H0H92_001129 [Tricholoma furcatifolium]